MLDLDDLAAAIAAHGPVARVVIAAHDGSSPREAGAAMLVWANGQSGTIGGGALEWEAAARARAMLSVWGVASGGQRDVGDRRAPVPSPHGDGEAQVCGVAAISTDGGSRGADQPAPPLPLVGRGEGVGGATPSMALPAEASEAAGPRTASMSRIDRIPLGPALGQCCGGAVTLVTEVFSAAPVPVAGVVARSLDGRDMPLAVKRVLDRARARGEVPGTLWLQGWLVESVATPRRHLWIWGAGHVGRAIVTVMAPLPDLAITWVDVAPDRFPASVPDGVTVLPAADPLLLVAHAPRDAHHLILTYSHALDLSLCHALLQHGFASAGLIGSATKWARFRSRLVALGHVPGTIARIRCPIGDPGLGKHPQAIALGVATEFLRAPAQATRQEITG